MLRLLGSGFVGLIAAASLNGSASAQEAGDLGVWRNPKNTVHVQIRPCGPGICGVVVWASPKAVADAKQGGTPDLIGQQLFRDFVLEKPGLWRGKVFVPDKNRTFSGTATLLDPTTIKAKGCLFMGLACKDQVWKRIDKPEA